MLTAYDEWLVCNAWRNPTDRVIQFAHLQVKKEEISHDAEIRRIAEKLGLGWPATIEDICKKIESIWKYREDFGPNGDATTPGFFKTP